MSHKKKRLKALKSLDGYIQLPDHQRKTLAFLQGVKVRLVSKLANGHTRVSLLESTPRRDFLKGKQINLLPGAFVQR